VQECKDKKSKPKNMSGAELLYLRMKVCLNPKQLLYLGMKVCHCRLSAWGACLSFAHTHLVRVYPLHAHQGHTPVGRGPAQRRKP
jgi:hypothetical protein